jgi:acetyl esterase/lipase
MVLHNLLSLSSSQEAVAKATKEDEEDDQCDEMDSLYGLHIHKSRHIHEKKRHIRYEFNKELIENTISAVQQLQDDLLELHYSEDVKQLVEQFRTLVHELKNNLLVIYQRLTKKYSLMEEKLSNDHSIQAFHFEHRGLLLTIIYTMNHFRMKKLKLDLKHLRKYCGRLVVLCNLTQMGVILTEERCEQIKKCRSQHPCDCCSLVSDYPFSDTIDLHEYSDLTSMENITDYFRRIGDQYNPRIRSILGLMVGVVAAHETVIEANKENRLFNTGLFLASNMYYFLNKKHAAQVAVQFFNTHLNQESARSTSLYTLPDTNPILKLGNYLSLPDILLSATFTIPFQRIESKTYSNNIIDNEFKVIQTETTKELIGQTTMQEFEFYHNQIYQILSKVNTLKPTINIRIISDHLLQVDGETDLVQLIADHPHLEKVLHIIRSKVPLRSSKHKKNQQQPNGFIFHVHGGGFFAMTSATHEVYLRPWAKATGLPIISVDYTQTPEQQYPVQLEECYQAYRWILSNATSVLGIKTDKIIFAGDSAGGNLVTSVLLRCIHDGIRIPDALVLVYPALYLHFAPSPARIISLLDPLLNFKLLELCGLQYYMNEHQVKNSAKHNAFISPVIAPQHILSQFPNTLVCVGSLDPLFDDGVYLAKRLEQLNPSKIKLDIYDGLSHGFLNLINVDQKQARVCSQRICDYIIKQTTI